MFRFNGRAAKAGVVVVLFLAVALYAQTPSAPVLSSPTNGAIGQSTAPALSWNAVSGASSYTLQVSQASTFSTMIINAGGIASTSQLVSGLVLNTSYYWRVSATGTGGTSSWSSIWSFTTEIPAIPTLLLPANGATNQILSVTMNWSTSNSATTYGLQVSNVSTFASIVSSQTGLNVTSASVPNLANGITYYWQANATNAAGTSAWSSVWSFTTGQRTSAPTLISPTNGAFNQPLALTLSWNSVITASSYALQVSTNLYFSTTLSSQTGITIQSAAMSGLSNSMNYYWRVYATGPYGTSNWSTVYSFSTTLQIPAAPLLTSPLNNATDMTYQPAFTWQALNNTTTYTFQLSSASNFSTTIASQSGLISRDSGFTLAFSTTYFWRVGGTNSIATGPWSSIWSFTVSAPIPGAPVLISPSNGASISPSTRFSWSIVAGATSYRLQIYFSIDYTYYVVNTLLSTNYWNDSLSSLTGGFWWVVSANNGSGSAWSATWYFVTTSSTFTLHRDAVSSPSSFSLQNSSLLYTLASPSLVSVSLYSMSGRKIAILNRLQSPGSYSLSLKNRNLSSGVYFLHFKAGLVEKRMKVVLPGG